MSTSPSPQEKILAARTLSEAISIGKRLWKNAEDDWPDDAFYFAKWMAAKSDIFIEDIAALEKTTTGLVYKDPDAERGKAICLQKHRIVDLRKHTSKKLDFGYYTGLLRKPSSQQYYSLYVIKDTGTLVPEQNAQFCGVVTGLYTYKNTGGGTTISLFLVGMFDLPSNHRPR
jgi:hypothetical protein